ncbi:MAG: TonB-dependent receptor [Bacteroidales bacterium]|nr:TonB-dependent receptor [Bacteroidales bacterium]
MKATKLLLTIAAFLMFTLPFGHNALAQSRIRVQGTVVDTKGEAVIGAMVIVKGTQNGAMTDTDGHYTLNSVPSNATLTVSLIGYEEQSAAVDGRTTIDFTLKDDNLVLEEAVAIGYGNQRKVTLTGSVASTTGDELVKNSSVNLSQGLAGRMSGVIVNNRSGEPGKDDAVMFIRGRSTLGDNSPLIIIDGVQGRGEEFGRLTGDEIESVTVLKDASAAIYGARSANGVILVTTKRGKYNEAPTVSFSYDLGLQSPTRMVKLADAVLYTTAYNAGLAITGGAPVYNDAQIQHYIDQDDPISYPNTDWLGEIIKPVSAQHKYGVSINGGSEKAAYFVQFNGQYQDGIYYESATNYNQYNLRSNLDIQVTKSLKLGVDINARQQHKNYSAFPSDNYGIFYIAQRMRPTGAAYFPEGAGASQGLEGRLLRGGTNPAVLVQDLTGYDRTTINTINTTFTATWDLSSLTKGLSVNGHLAYDLVSKFNKNWQQNWNYYSYDEITELFEERSNSYWPTPVLHEYQTHTHNTAINANINYDRDFSGHHVTALAGFEQNAYRLDYFKAGINSYASDILDEFFAGTADKSWYAINGYARETARRSFFGRVGYDFKSKYLFQALIRFDGSENFPAEKRWGVFPGVSVGWRLSEEPFIKDNAPWLTNLKIRASYGEQGNDQIDPFQYMTTYGYTSAYSYKTMFDGKEVNFIIPGTIPNTNVTWEVAKTWNVGIDGNIGNGLFGWELEAFYTNRSNILCTRNASVPYYTGLTNNLPDENIGIVNNRGVELQMSHENRLLGGDLRYRINGNFMYAKNKIVYMDEAPWPEGHDYMKLEGMPMGSALYYKVGGINKTEDDLKNHPQMSGATLGDFWFEDLDGDKEITSLDRYRMGYTAVPQIVFGLSFDAFWKNIDFSLLLQGQGLARYYYSPAMDPVSGNLDYFAAANAWRLDNTDSDYPRIGSTVSNGGVNRSDFYSRNAAFVRLKNVELGYTLPTGGLSYKLGIRSLRFYIAGYNLLTFSELKFVDPETSDESYQTYPQMRIVNTGVKLTF